MSIRDTILKEFTDVVINKLHFNNLRLVAKEHFRHFSYEGKLKEREKKFGIALKQIFEALTSFTAPGF